MSKIYKAATCFLIVLFLGACDRKPPLRAVPKAVSHSFDQRINEPVDSDAFFNLYILEDRQIAKYEPTSFFVGESLPSREERNKVSIAPTTAKKSRLKDRTDNAFLCQITSKLEEAFPVEDLLEALARGQMPLIIMEATESLSLSDMEKRATEAAVFQVPMFLLFKPDKLMSSKLYKELYITMADIFAKKAPHVAFIWAVDLKEMDSLGYYPGDEWVDWVGFFLLENIVHLDMDDMPYDNYTQQLELFMSQITSSKPIMAFYGVSHHSTQNNRYYIEEANLALETFTKSLLNYPNVLSLVLQLEDSDTDRYNMYDNDMVKAHYFQMIAGLAGDMELTDKETVLAYRLSDFLVWKVSDSFYVPQQAIYEEFNISQSVPTQQINQEPMVAFYDIKKYIDFDFKEDKERQAIFLWKDRDSP